MLAPIKTFLPAIVLLMATLAVSAQSGVQPVPENGRFTRLEDGVMTTTTYRNGLKQGKETIVDRKGTVTVRRYRKGQRHGRWRVDYASGSSLRGRYRRGERHGKHVSRNWKGKLEVKTKWKRGRVIRTRTYIYPN